MPVPYGKVLERAAADGIEGLDRPAAATDGSSPVKSSTSSTSVWARVEPSGFLPTSVSGGYGGITSEFVRDGAGMSVHTTPSLFDVLSLYE